LRFRLIDKLFASLALQAGVGRRWAYQPEAQAKKPPTVTRRRMETRIEMTFACASGWCFGLLVVLFDRTGKMEFP